MAGTGIEVVSAIASIAQLIELTIKVYRRVDEFQSHAREIPQTFRRLSYELPVLQETLQKLGEAIDSDKISEGIQAALTPSVKGCLEQAQSLHSILEKTLPGPDDSWREKTIKAIASLLKDSKVEKKANAIHHYMSALTFYLVASSSSLQPPMDEKLVKICQWLSAPDPSVNYHRAIEQRQVNTGGWFLESEQFSTWKMGAASFLWLYGIPGCGKTILSSTILQSLFDLRQQDIGDAVAYFYFDFTNPRMQNSELMVSSLISQLAQQSVKCPATLEKLFTSYGKGGEPPPLCATLEVLRELVLTFPQTHFVLDALDECADRKKLMATLGSMAAWKIETLHLLVTSRKEREITDSLERFVDPDAIIGLQRKSVDVDIQTYVHQRLSDDQNLEKWRKDDKIREEIETAVSKGAHGMFRWAACQLDSLERCRNVKSLRNSLSTLPQTLDETYDRILCAISKDDTEYAIRILTWLAFSKRPLQVKEISEVIALDPERNPAFDPEEVLQDASEVLDICSSLVTIANDRKSAKIVLLAHYSVKEYLISDRCSHGPAPRFSMQMDSSNELIAKSCVRYLLQFPQPDSLSTKTMERCKLALYSAEFWISHTRAGRENTNALNQTIMELFLASDETYYNWIRICDPERAWRGTIPERERGEMPLPLYCASRFGLTGIVELLLSRRADVNAQSGIYGNALTAASMRGHKDIVELLLSNGANINVQGGNVGNALKAALLGGHKDIVELLINKGANVNAKGGDFGNAPQAASIRDYTALATASIRGYKDIVELLLSKGADVNVQGGIEGNALQAASQKGHKDIVKLLLAKKPNVNAQGGRYGTALQAASSGGYKDIVELLLREGADVNAQGGIYQTALTAASQKGHKDIVKLLLAKRAKVNTRGGRYGNALQAAMSGGYDDIVKLLRSKGAKA